MPEDEDKPIDDLAKFSQDMEAQRQVRNSTFQDKPKAQVESTSSLTPMPSVHFEPPLGRKTQGSEGGPGGEPVAFHVWREGVMGTLDILTGGGFTPLPPP